MTLVGTLAAQDDSTNQEILQNPDFSDGSTHWHGDCKPAGDDMTTDFTSSSTANVKGIVVDLRHSNWTKVTQDLDNYPYKFNQDMVLTVVYQTSSDFAFSTQNSDYGSAASEVGFPNAPLPIRAGMIEAFIDIPPASRTSSSVSGSVDTITIYPDRVGTAQFTPATDASPQTFTAHINPPPPVPDSKPTLCLAFPPGSGTVTLLKVSLVPGTQRQVNPGGPFHQVFPGRPQPPLNPDDSTH